MPFEQTQAKTMTEFPPDLSEMPRGAWLTALREIGETHGFSEPLGRGHAGIFVEKGDTLLVSFENMAMVEALSPTRTPLGFSMVAQAGWSCLSVLSHGDTWFRDAKVYEFFDQMLDDGFFDEFERVIFHGAGPGAYAACAYSVAAPGARVFAVQPQATLDPALASWDTRFSAMRRRDFTSRFGFAPRMVDAAQQAYVLYDPRETLDAMHAAMFHGDNVMHLRMPFMGIGLIGALWTMNIWGPLLQAAGEDRLDQAFFARAMRARRDHLPYLRQLLGHLDATERTGLTEMLCNNVVSRKNAPRFRKRLTQLRAGADGQP